ncbi:hypothetical protein M8J76_004390 [Diaphorina citri]|nr:hypothetical protein M8J76_004390 [Diaphorina citri]
MVLDFEPISGQSTDGTRILNTQFISPFRTGYVRCKGVCMPEYYVNFAEDIINMDVRDDDVWVCSFPKTGTTWTQEMVWCIANNLDFEAAKVFLPERFPFLEHTPLFDYRNKPELQLPVYVRDSIIYVTRNPKDTCVSYYHHCQLLEGYRGNFEDFFKIFMDGLGKRKEKERNEGKMKERIKEEGKEERKRKRE